MLFIVSDADSCRTKQPHNLRKDKVKINVLQIYSEAFKL